MDLGIIVTWDLFFGVIVDWVPTFCRSCHLSSLPPNDPLQVLYKRCRSNTDGLSLSHRKLQRQLIMSTTSETLELPLTPSLTLGRGVPRKFWLPLGSLGPLCLLVLMLLVHMDILEWTLYISLDRRMIFPLPLWGFWAQILNLLTFPLTLLNLASKILIK